MAGFEVCILIVWQVRSIIVLVEAVRKHVRDAENKSKF